MKPFFKWDSSRHTSMDGRLPDVDYVNNCMMNIEPIDTGLADFIVIFLRKENYNDEFGIEFSEKTFKVEKDIVVEVTVAKVAPNSAAKKACIECGDQVVQINSETVTSKQCAEDLLARASRAAYVNIIRLREMFQKPTNNDKIISTRFCYPFSQSFNKYKCKHAGEECTNKTSNKICSILLDQLKKRLLQKQKKTYPQDSYDHQENSEHHSHNILGQSKDDIRVGTNSPESMEDCLLMYTSPRHLAKTMRLQQEIFKRLVIAKKVGSIQTCSTGATQGKLSSSSVIRELSDKSSSKWIIRKRSDGTRYVTKRITDDRIRPTERNDSTKPSRKLLPFPLPRSLNVSEDNISSSEIEKCSDIDKNILSVMIL